MPKDYVKIGEQYARDVVDGKIVACHWVVQACKRQLRDLERQEQEGWLYRFDEEKGNRFCKFFELMPHVKGRWASPTLKMEPWQCFIFTAIFGWVRKDSGVTVSECPQCRCQVEHGARDVYVLCPKCDMEIGIRALRRFRKALIAVPAGNGKSSMCAVVGLYLLALDDEPGAGVYAAALNRGQAKIVWGIAKQMVDKSKGLRARFGVDTQAGAITVERTASTFQPVSRDARTLQGLDASGVIIDELAQHKTREVFDVMEDRTRSRKQPLTFYISTESDQTVGAFVEQVDYAQQILDGTHEDESYFGVIYMADKMDDWTDQACWSKANPNLGVSVSLQEMEDRCRRAMKNPAAQASFLTTRLNRRVGAGMAYFNGLAWKESCYDKGLRAEDYAGQPCVICVDLASKTDMAAAVKLFETEDGPVTCGNRFYLPEDRLEKGNPNYDLYRGWAEKGYLTLTPGNVIDYEYIERDLSEDRQTYYVRKVGVDEWNAIEFSTRMANEGAPVEIVPQTTKRLSEPMKMIQALIDGGGIRHDGNPILSWNISNMQAKPDANDNVFPRKARAENKIDGGTALIGAYSLVIVPDEGEDSESVYEGRGLRFL